MEQNISQELHSFDIFDTIITRRFAPPSGIFALIQHLIQNNPNLPDFVKNNFYKIRIGAEEIARCRNLQDYHISETTIYEIYQVFKDNYNVSDDGIKELIQLEIDTEIKNLLPVEKNLNLLKELVSKGHKVVLISDMYLDENQLRSMLCKIDSVFENITIYSSADYKVSKVSGKLYKIVKEKENCSVWHHYGDHIIADIKSAEGFGIITHYCPQETLMNYETDLLSKYNDNPFFQAVIGSAKLARRNKPEIKSDKYNFGASFSAPILYSYVEWVINQALEKGLKTLYFIARDGYIPKVIADIIIEKRNLPIKTKYIYGSRLAWRVPISNNFDKPIDWLFEEYKDSITPEFLSYRLGVDADEIKQMLGLKTINSKINEEQGQIFAEKFKNNEEIKNKIISINKEKIDLLLEYFKQEIDFSEDNIAFVDVHGSGRTQDCVAALLNEIKPCTVYSFYITNTLTTKVTSSVKLCYFATLKYLSDWVELLCRTADGQTIGYKKVGDRIEPVTEQKAGEKMLEWGFEEYLAGIKEYTKYMAEAEVSNQMDLSTLDLFCKYGDYINNNLDRETAVILGDIPYKTIGSEENICPAAPEIPFWQPIFDNITKNENRDNGIFPGISYIRSSKLSQKSQDLVKEYPNLQKFLFNFYINRKTQTAFICLLGFKFSFGNILWRTK